MSPDGVPRHGGLASLVQAIALELALARPGSSAGAAETANLLSELVSRLSGYGQAEFESMSHVIGSVILDLQGDSGCWQHRHIDLLSTSLMRIEAILEDGGAGQGDVQPFEEDATATDEMVADEDTILIDGSSDRDFLREFCSEGRDLLQDIEKGVLVLEQTPYHRETLNAIFRAFHTFKGGAGFLGLLPVKQLSHELESLLDAIRQGRILAGREIVDLILAGGDCLGKFVDAISRELDEPSGKAISIPTAWLKSRVVARLSGEEVNDPPSQSIAADAGASVSPSSARSAALPEPSAKREQNPAPITDGQVLTSPPEAPAAMSEVGEANASIRIGLEKLDVLVDLVAELVIAQSMVLEGAATGVEDNSPLSRDILVLQRITKELQHNAMSLRMVPVRVAFQKMQRLVRDLAGRQGKVIHLKLTGEETEIDRNIVAQLTDPLIHMIRNACDHGIEMPQERVAAGKPSHGTLSLSAYHQGGGIVIRISDDGRGLDPEKIRKKAVERGLIPADAELARDDILQLIFAPGFSTAETVTDLSGRGVGMDVVRGNIARLRGRTEIDSAVGAGTTFTIYLPLTLAIIQGMVVGVGKERFIIPTLAIRESFKPEPHMITPLLGRGSVINRRGRLLPVLHLGGYLGVRASHADPTDGIAIIVESGTSQCCFMVDRLIGKSEVVIKDLGDLFGTQGAMSGAAILGDGRVALIIDVEHMVSVATAAVKRKDQARRQVKPAPAVVG